jgi:hypothetical protein
MTIVALPGVADHGGAVLRMGIGHRERSESDGSRTGADLEKATPVDQRIAGTETGKEFGHLDPNVAG